MDLSFINTEEYKNYIARHINDDANRLRLQKTANMPFDVSFAILQIECRRKMTHKLPSLSDKIVYPTGLSTEQCTSERLAEFHASLFNNCESVVDFTCGLGIDSYFIATQASRLTSIELDPAIANVAQHNFKSLGAQNITVINTDAETFAQNSTEKFTAGFIDPARRSKSDKNKRLYGISDCSPNLGKIIRQMHDKLQFLIVKASPMVDITQTLHEYANISDVWVLSLKNECKELLFKIDFSDATNMRPIIHTLDFESDTTHEFSTHQFSAPATGTTPIKPGDFLYAPNASILKAGIFNEVCHHFNLGKIADNSHLFVSSIINGGFPGRIFEIVDCFSLSKPDTKRLKEQINTANITCRNFPLKPEELRKRLKISDGGDNYLFATTTADNKRILLLCTKINA